jgi:hypothetical protein
MNKNTKYVYEYILNFFESLKYLSVIGSAPLWSFRNVSLATCSSSNLYKLCIPVRCFEDCFALLDGRFKHLTTLIIDIVNIDPHSSAVYNMVSLNIIRLILFFQVKLFRVI